MLWVAFALAGGAAWWGWRRYRRHRASKDLALMVAMPLILQTTLFPHETGTPAEGRAADLFSTGYVFAFTITILVASGRRDVASMGPMVVAVFEVLFGRGGGNRAKQYDRAIQEHSREARAGAEVGRQDAKRFLESGGQRQVTGWLQYVCADVFSDAAA